MNACQCIYLNSWDNLLVGDNMNIKRIKDLREDNDLTQDEVAELLLITRQQYSLYELGKRTFPIDYLNLLADFYKTSVDYLIKRTDVKKPYPKINKNLK